MQFICLALCGVIAVIVIISHIERRDLYDRLMSCDLEEYQRITERSEEAPRQESAHVRAIKKWRNMENGE